MPKKLTDQKVIDIMRKISLMSLAVCGEDKQPQSHMVLFTVDDDFTITFATTTSSKKYVAMKENNKVGVSILSDKEIFVQIVGETVELVDEAFINALEKLAEAATNLPNFWHPLLQIAKSNYCAFKLIPTSIRVLDLSSNTISHSTSPFTNIKIPI